MSKTRSPLKDRPWNVPGQSADKQLAEFADTHFILPLFFVFAIFMATIWEWYADRNHLPRNPALLTFISATALVALLAYWRIRWNKAMALKLGRDGERVVGQFLETHIESDATVFHDVPTGRGNIDHVIVCSRGVYAIETKTRTKPVKGQANVVVTNERLTVAGYTPDRNPINQARACADALMAILIQSTGKPFRVQPVVLFPGWWIEDKRPKGMTYRRFRTF